jgi:hypothetical protein
MTKGLLTLVLLAVASMTPARAETSGPVCEVTVYWDIDLQGDRLVTNRNQQNLSTFGTWNDQISSIYVAAGIWDFFEHADYTGESLRLTPGVYDMNEAWNDRISSFRCVQPTSPP